MREFAAKGHELQALTVGTDDLPGLTGKIHNIGYALTTAHLALEEDLNRLRSTEVPQDSWLPLANGLLIGTETDWDRIITIITDAVTKPTAEECRAMLKGIHPLIRSIGKGISDQIAIENAAHDPNKI
ncbi:hypothetical protein A0J57_18225 [Sphingobium sp. 22B]|nr:hypothetical protein AXW74_24205 [Sphingobium sp. AM]KYC30929.1 hypothetical protein A0J57_18225 [Sphingobium sp. 22B]OAP30461.1 hypothetical protein A8O16_18515 [Sphingobium sp. 20006FA]